MDFHSGLLPKGVEPAEISIDASIDEDTVDTGYCGPLGFNGMLLSELFPPMGLSLFDIGPGKRGPPPPGPPGIPCCDCGLGIGKRDPAPEGSFGVRGPGL